MARLVLFIATITACAQVQNFKPVTTEMLVNPSPNDWLMYSRTYDAQRYSPLNQINKRNVSQLRLAWTRGMAAGQTESIPLVYNGVMYTVIPGAAVQALDATTGDLLWEYKRKVPANVAASARTKNLAIYDDIVAIPLQTATSSAWMRAPASFVGNPRPRIADTPPVLSSSKARRSRGGLAPANGRTVSLPRTMSKPERNCGDSTPLRGLANRAMKPGRALT
jgi:hypothetical protein